MAEKYASTTVNVATALEFFSRMCSLQSLEMLESEHHLVTALSVSVANDPEANQRMEDRSLGKDRNSCERGLLSTHECEVSGGISHGQPMRKPLSTTHGNGGSI